MERDNTASMVGFLARNKAASLALSLLFALLASAPLGAQSITVYRCVDAATGRVALQDQPCPPGEETTRRRVAAAADSPVSISRTPKPAAAAPAVPEPVAQTPRSAPPELWRCVDFEGTERYADRRQPNGRYVPLWVVRGGVGGPRGLAGRAGQPGLSAGRDAAAATEMRPGTPVPMVYVEDRCFLLPPDAACRHYRTQREAIERRRWTRTGDERRQLDAESERLYGILTTSCG